MGVQTWALLLTFVSHVFLPGIDGPQDLAVTGATSSTMELSWRPGRVKPAKYVLVYWPSTGGVQNELILPGDATTSELSNLEPGTNYLMGLHAERGSHQSLPANVTGSTSKLWLHYFTTNGIRSLSFTLLTVQSSALNNIFMITSRGITIYKIIFQQVLVIHH